MKLQLVKGTTSQTLLIFVQNSSVTTGAGLTGLAFNSSGLTAYYYREGQGTGATQITLVTATLGTYTSSGFVEVDATDMPGWYEVGIPDAVLASGADFVGIQYKGATNMAPVNIEIQLTDLNVNDGVRAGLTALPNAAAGTATGLPNDTDANGRVRIVDGTGAGELQTASGRVDANVTFYGGVAGTFSGGIPEVNLAQWLGTAPLGLSSQRVQALVGAMSTGVVTADAIAADAIGSSELAASAVTEITDDIMAEVIETQGSYTVQQALSIILAVLAGETSGGGVTISTPNGVSTRVSATVDASNNRTAMTLTPSS